MIRRSLQCSLAAVSVGCVLGLACGGALEQPEERRASGGVADGSAGPPDQQAARAGASRAPAGGAECASLGASCRIFEPGGPERWGCFTVGTDPELACEHATGASIAHCNCSGAFGEPPPAPQDVAWFDIPATSRIPAEGEIVELWRKRCHDRCVPRRNDVPPPIPDAG